MPTNNIGKITRKEINGQPHRKQVGLGLIDEHITKFPATPSSEFKGLVEEPGESSYNFLPCNWVYGILVQWTIF